jgi:protein SCO1/2
MATVVLAGAFLLLLGAGIWYWNSHRGSSLPVVSRVPVFQLTTERGQTYTRDSLLNRVTIVDFIFTSCGGTCPMMSTRMSEIQQELAGDPKVHLLSYSVDPETDTPEVLAAYGQGYDAIPGRWTFLTGPKKAIFDLTRNGYHLGLDTEGLEAIIHSQKFVLVDCRGDIRGYYDSEDAEAMKNLVTHARELASEIVP